MKADTLKKANQLNDEIIKLTETIEAVVRIRKSGNYLRMRGTSEYDTVYVPEEIKEQILDIVEGYLTRKRWDVNGEFESL